ncbi:MAG TPA: globin-coupled sensor protein [Rhizobium sp.]
MNSHFKQPVSNPISNTGVDEAVDDRLKFMQMTPESCSAIRSLKGLVDRELPIALDKFYTQMRKTPETLKFFSSEDQIARAKGAQTGHWENISNGNFNQDYVGKVRTIGTVHARIGLEPKWYIGAYAIVLDHLINAAVEEAFPKGGLFSKKTMTAGDFGKALGSLAKAVLLDMDLAISVYLEEAEKAKQAAQTAAISAERELVSGNFGTAMSSLANKDLRFHMSGELPEAYHALRDDFNNSVDTLSSALQAVGETTASINAAAREIGHAADDLSKRTEQQAASVEETAAALEEITNTVRTSAQRAEEAGALVARTKTGAEKSGAVVQQAITAMGEIERSSREIGNIIGVIDEIAFQTNLLALNAGVEAARAGDAGRGFAVVAQEVRQLAQRSATAAKEIKALITKSGEQVSSGVALVGDTGKALETIIGDVEEINRNVTAIVEAAREQSTGLQEINNAVATIDQGTQQNAAMVEQTTAASHNLATEVHELNQLLGQFQLGQTPAPAFRNAPAPVASSSPARVLTNRLSRAFSGNAALAQDDWQEF